MLRIDAQQRWLAGLCVRQQPGTAGQKALCAQQSGKDAAGQFYAQVQAAGLQQRQARAVGLGQQSQ